MEIGSQIIGSNMESMLVFLRNELENDIRIELEANNESSLVPKKVPKYEKKPKIRQNKKINLNRRKK